MLRALSLMYEVASNFAAITNYHMEAWDMHFWHFSAFSYSLATILDGREQAPSVVLAGGH